MRKNDAPALGDIPAALGLLTRLPAFGAAPRGAVAAWAYPLAGMVIGLIAGCAGLITLWAGLPAPLAALVTLTTQIALTGAMHEDGLADSVDGLWGGWTRARRLEIMKDSHIGAFGVIALILSLSARWAALWLLFQHGNALAAIIVAAALSRAALPALMRALPHARGAGLSHGVGRPAWRIVGWAVGVAAIAAVVLLGWSGIGAILWALIATIAVGWIAQAKIGGQTGDILGAAQQVAEIAVLLSIIA
ncbi:adenosylcobinamide-GDP ribazoletransferase [Pelagivirga sediminicola]|uniref:Adenosylcobinamide-GDP ribazoletransferase n=1 Tax=Pelagivirga sediminicola TaxID=2170575 RepID=A0A2T7GC02_9RHOB|nr:adenosylcobinamide-GDP ribazoletransferase [Pelagivirga sediminicola]PVA11936.1 adenosylcobinamide-GDP ribazoletransferase [Pelagivirga sediminicola]